MQGFERADRQLLDAEMLAGHLVPQNSMFAFLAAHRAEVFPDAGYADLFAPPGFGRPSLPATRMAAVLTLQVLHDYSDRETAEAVRFDVRWKVACGLAVGDAGFDASSLVYWRQRIARSERPRRVNDAVKKIVAEAGVLRGRRRRAAGSAILADGVSAQDTITQLVSAVRRAAREVAGAGLEEPAASALALLALVAGQDVEPAEGSDGSDGRRRIARKVAGDRAISTVEPDARHTRKSPEARRDGYRAHVAASPQTGIITDEKLTRAAGTENSDPAVAEEFLAAETAGDDGDRTDGEHADRGAACSQDSGDDRDDDRLAWYGDSACGTGGLRGAIDDAGRDAVIKPKPLQAPVEGGFTIDDFSVGEQAGTATCPAGHTVQLSRTRVATFGILCRGCPLRQQCPTCKTGRKLVLHQRDDLLRAARADWAAGTGLRQDYTRYRPNIERTIAQVATWRGRRLKLRYRGVARNHAWLKRRTAALNLRNLTGKGLARRDGAWRSEEHTSELQSQFHLVCRLLLEKKK